MMVTVGDSRRKSQSHHQGIQLFAYPTHSILPLDTSNGGSFLHVLHIVESFPNATGGRCDRAGHIPKRQSGITRGSRAKIGRLSINDTRALGRKRSNDVAKGGIRGEHV